MKNRRCRKVGGLGPCKVTLTVRNCTYPKECPYIKPHLWAQLAEVRPDRFTSAGPRGEQELEE